MRGWWNMPCWNGLSAEQQRRLIEVGNLPFGYQPEGECRNGAELCIETMNDEAPGPRFYCRPCGVAFLAPGLANAARRLGGTADHKRFCAGANGSLGKCNCGKDQLDAALAAVDASKVTRGETK